MLIRKFLLSFLVKSMEQMMVDVKRDLKEVQQLMEDTPNFPDEFSRKRIRELADRHARLVSIYLSARRDLDNLRSRFAGEKW